MMEVLPKTENLIDIKQEMRKEQTQLAIRRFFANRMVLTGSIIVLIIMLFAIFGPLLATHGPLEMEPTDRLKTPSSENWFGTDNYGRDVFSRVAHGARVSFGVGVSVAIITGIMGLITGLLSAYYRPLDHILMRISDGLMAFPAILLAIAVMATLGPRMENVIIALSIVYTPYVARVIRSSALVIREQTYIEALHSQGARDWRIIFLHIAPNTVSPLIVQSTFIFANAIITEAALSFLGAGVPAPNPSWGNILYDGKLVIFKAWWMTVFPGIAIMLSVLGLNLFGDGLRDLLDPHTNKVKK
jgi:peptide/nickel transport system permease protein